jgi:hypothetical protein
MGTLGGAEIDALICRREPNRAGMAADQLPGVIEHAGEIAADQGSKQKRDPS